MFQDLTQQCAELKDKKYTLGSWGTKYLINQQQLTHAHTHTHTLEILQSRVHNVPNWSGRTGGQEHTLTDNTHSLIYKYYIEIDICTTHTTILYIPKEEKRHVYDITQRRDERKKNHKRTHSTRFRAEDSSFLLPWPYRWRQQRPMSSCHYHHWQ